jgi:pyridoxine 5-phosphate synthase
MDSEISFSAITISELFSYKNRIKVVNCTPNNCIKNMTRLSVNINKIATLRNTRQGNIPNVKLAAINCEEFGAEGITVHPRPDERHIRYSDVRDLKPIITTEFNIEGYPLRSFLDLVIEVKPNQVTLVPDAPDAITSNAGWDTVTNKDFLTEVIRELKNAGIRVSLFVGADPKMVEGAAIVGADRIELYTEPYASAYPFNPDQAILPFIQAAQVAADFGLGVNAGHDLSLANLKFFKQSIPSLLEVSIGHALIADALYLGLELTILKYKECLR